MYKILQINVTSNWGSTGRIAEQIGVKSKTIGIDSYIAYGRYSNTSQLKSIRIGSQFDVYEHYIENCFLCNEGLASRIATRNFIMEIEKIKPDLIHLHNIHDHYLNFPVLFEYLRINNIQTVWTQHDMWAITGHCAFCFDGCDKWQTVCNDCPALLHLCIDKTKRNYELKKSVFTSVRNMTIVPVSDWLGSQFEKSFLRNYPRCVIKNGVDIDIFKPIDGTALIDKYELNGKHIILAVATVWNERKNISDYIKLSELLSDDYMLVLIGVTKVQKKNFPPNMKGIERTHNQSELAKFYSIADILLSLSLGETFGMTMAEAFACGTPCIVYDNTAQPEIVTPETGRVVKTGDIEALAATVEDMVGGNFKQNHSADCRKRAEEHFDKDKCFEKYIELYNSLLDSK